MFVLGGLYQRQELLDFVGSKQTQSGILWNKYGSDVVIITSGGRHGESASYIDEMQPDGSWLYYGQGSQGDQNPYSAANSLLSSLEKKVLLFTTREVTSQEAKKNKHRKKSYKFEGLFKVVSWSLEAATEGKRKGDKLVKYLLYPIEDNNSEILHFDDPLGEITLDRGQFYELRKKLNAKHPGIRKSKVILTEYKDRSSQIKLYALLRAEGVCENCGNKAPFENANNIPFLEVHHIFSLSDEGPDTAVNVAAICPNCHKEAHYGKNKETLKSKLSKIILEKENLIDNY